MNIPMNNSYIEVDMQILRENMASIASTLTPGAGIIPVLKDDAYGLGLVPVARVLEPLDCVRCFSVSHVSEGLELRRGSISKGIIVMNSALPFQLEAAVEAGLSLACGRPGFVTELQAAARAVGKAAHIHIKVDTGLHRIGFVPGEELGAFVAELRAAGDDIVVDGVFSHFSAPESLERDEEEYARFLEGIAQLESAGVQIPFKHISCSAASERYPKFDMDAVRIGRRLYMDAPDEPLGTIKELASWRSYVAAVHERRAGDRLGYGEGLTLDKDTRVATVGIGYGDGLALRFAEVNAPVLICGKMAHVIAVFMDQCLVDVTGIDCVPGDEVTIFGYDGHGGYISSHQGDGRNHKGIDIAAPYGTPIYAAASGTVTDAGTGWNGGYGNCIVIENDDGNVTVYAHQAELAAEVGDYIEAGQLIGYVGSTGDSTGNHLHFEIRKDGKYLDPENFVAQ